MNSSATNASGNQCVLLAESISKLASAVRAAQRELEGRLSVSHVEEVAMTSKGIRDGLVQSYAECFKSTGALVERRLGRECKAKLEEMVKANYRDESVREAFESLINAEEEWGEFMERFEAKWAAVHPPLFQGSAFLQEGDNVPEDVLAKQFIEVASKEVLPFSDVISQAPFSLLLFFRVIG